MTATKMEYLELTVFVGKEKTSMRLVICLLPEEVYEKRIRIRNKKNKSKNCKTTDEYKGRALRVFGIISTPRFTLVRPF